MDIRCMPSPDTQNSRPDDPVASLRASALTVSAVVGQKTSFHEHTTHAPVHTGFFHIKLWDLRYHTYLDRVLDLVENMIQNQVLALDQIPGDHYPHR